MSERILETECLSPITGGSDLSKNPETFQTDFDPTPAACRQLQTRATIRHFSTSQLLARTWDKLAKSQLSLPKKEITPRVTNFVNQGFSGGNRIRACDREVMNRSVALKSNISRQVSSVALFFFGHRNNASG